MFELRIRELDNELKLYSQFEAALTKRKIHDANDMEPKTPESASCAVKIGRAHV